METIKRLISHTEIPRPNIRVVFTPDEEVGAGTSNVSLEKLAAHCAYTIDGGENILLKLTQKYCRRLG